MNGIEITELNIPERVTAISANFNGFAGLTSVTIPNSVTEIGNNAFYGCTSLKSVKVEWTRPLALNDMNRYFDTETQDNGVLYVPKGTAMMYMAASVWSSFKNIVEYENGDVANYITIRMGDGGVLKQSVEVGKTYLYSVAPDEGWEVNTVTFNGRDMTALLDNGQFSTPVITGSSELNVVFRQKASNAKTMMTASDVKVAVRGRSVIVTGAEDDVLVVVYDVNGLPVTSAVGNATLTLDGGAYIVKVGEETFKVNI